MTMIQALFALALLLASAILFLYFYELCGINKLQANHIKKLEEELKYGSESIDSLNFQTKHQRGLIKALTNEINELRHQENTK